MKAIKQQLYFVGIGGIGMSALARYFHQLGHKVVGYDRTITVLTKRLQSEGIIVNYVDDADLIPFSHRDTAETLVIYTPAIPADNAILNHFKKEGFECVKRAAILGILSKQFKTIAVSGTHGKTTISSMIAFLLNKGGVKVNAFLGGISRDFGTNLLLDKDAEWMVTEADEFDRSFLQLNPEKLVISSLDADHLDIYSDREDLVKTYAMLVAQVKKDGLLVCKPTVFDELKEQLPKNTETYQLSGDSTIKAEQIRVENGNLIFNYVSDKVTIKDILCGLPGQHNVENALAAIRIALEFDISTDKIKSAMASFLGVKRRFDVHVKTDEVVYIDDYAHHPEEVRALIESVKMLYPGKKITAIFQPHLFSRTRDFGDEFAKVLGLADELILLEIYPAREQPIEGIDAMWLSKKINKTNVPVCQKHQLINVLKNRELKVLLTIGAGDIDTMIDPIINFIESQE
tara:strand:- start:1106 stop:2482 length:1377 start_codon:yes stop_codon:yes gene_type:complete